ncbi:MAG TPA: hypothetical protein VF282_05795 [Bacillota bacterium]
MTGVSKAAGRLQLVWPHRDQAWLSGPEAAEQGIDPARVRALLEEARAGGARAVRTAVPAAAAGDGLVAAGFQPGPLWLTAAVSDPLELPSPAEVFSRFDLNDPTLRVRRISSGQWHNPRVRLAVQGAVEQGLREGAPDARDDPSAPFGLIAAGDEAFPLCGWGPFDLIEAMGRGEVVTAGDPVRPAGVMLLRETRAEQPGRRLLVHFLAGAEPVVAALLAYTAERLRQLRCSWLEASLPAAQGRGLQAWIQDAPGVRLQPWRIYDAVPAPS